MGQVSLPASPIEVGGRFTLAATVRSRTAQRRVGHISVRLRRAPGSGSGRVVARKVLKGLRGRRSFRFKAVVRIPRTLVEGRYRVTVCASTADRPTGCKQAKRLMSVVAPKRSPATAPPVGVLAPPPIASHTPAPLDGPLAPPGVATLGTVAGPAVPVYQTFQGFMTHQRNFDDSHVFNNFDPVTGKAATTMTTAQQDAVLDAIYVELGITAVEVFGEPPIQATDGGLFDFDANGGKAGSGVAPLVGRVASRVPAGFKCLFAPAFRETWMDSELPADVTKYSSWLLAQLKYFVANGGVLTDVAVANEPSYTDSNPMSGAFTRDVIKDLAPRMAADGLGAVKFSATSDVNPSVTSETLAPVLADATAAAQLSSLSTHLYGESITNMGPLVSTAAARGLPLWMTEWSVAVAGSAPAPGELVTGSLGWPDLIDLLLTKYNVSLLTYQTAFFGEWKSDSTLITLNTDASNNYTGFTRTKEYYYTGQWSREVKPGAKRVAVTPGNAAVRATMFSAGTKRTIVALNLTGASITTTLKSADLAGVSTMTSYRTSSTENWATTATPSVSGNAITVTLPPGSVTTFVGALGDN